MYWNRSPRAGSFLGLDLVVPLGTRPPPPDVTVAAYPSHSLALRPAIGALATVRLPSSRRLIGEVDGGNGHASDSAPELLFGLGRNAGNQIAVQVTWRAVGGELRHARLELAPGWHTVVLG
jgi:hypothetical protein